MPELTTPPVPTGASLELPAAPKPTDSELLELVSYEVTTERDPAADSERHQPNAVE